MTTQRNTALKAQWWAPAMLCLLALGGCSGGGGSDAPVAAGDDPVGGIDGGGRTILVVGPVSGFGSVIVNGIRFDTTDATITVKGDVVAESALRVGQIVRVAGAGAEGDRSATSIEFDENVEGPISAIDAAAGTLVVLGQTVRVNGATLLDTGTSADLIDDLLVGDVVEVSGYVTSDGSILATRIDKTDSDDLDVVGLAASVDSALLTFNINDLTVDYSAASLQGFANGAPEDGDIVDVRGSALASDGSLLADRVIRLTGTNELDLDDADIDIEGVITDFVSAADFVVAGVSVTTDDNTRFEDGIRADLANDVLVEVEGTIDENGRLLARSIEIEDDGFAEIDAQVEAVDVAAGQLVLLGITVTVEPDTRFEADDGTPAQAFSLNDITVGDWLDISGFQTGTDSVTARTIEREDADDDVKLQGLSTDVADPELRVLGVRVVTDSNTDFDDITAAQFFAEADGRIVDVRGTWDGVSILASELEFEDRP